MTYTTRQMSESECGSLRIFFGSISNFDLKYLYGACSDSYLKGSKKSPSKQNGVTSMLLTDVKYSFLVTSSRYW